MNKDTYKKLKDLTYSYNQADDGEENAQFMIKIEDLLLNEAKKEPENNDIWFMLMSLQYYPPLEEGDLIDEYANQVLKNDPENINALIVKAYSSNLFGTGIPDEVALKLSQYEGKDPEKEAMALIVLKFYYENNKNWKMVEQCLKKAITLAPHFAKPYFELGYYYLNNYKDRKENAQALFKMGLKNTTPRDWSKYVDLTDINMFFQDFITATHTDQTVIDLAVKCSHE